MSDNMVRLLSIGGLQGYEPEIGTMLWMLEEGRNRLKEGLTDIDSFQEQKILDWRPHQGVNSIGTLLYHIAAIEIDWLFTEVLADYSPPTAVSWPDPFLPYDVRTNEGDLTPVTNENLSTHLQRLDSIRILLLEAFRDMSLAEFRRLRHLEQYDVTPEWVLFHLIQHEAEHRGQILERINEAQREL